MGDILINQNLEPLRKIIDSPFYKEIVISEPFKVKIETMRGEWIVIEDQRLSLQYLYGLCRLLATKEGKLFNEEEPTLSATIDNKHRVNVVYGKQTNNNIAITIRLKRNSNFTLDNFFLNEEDKNRLITLVQKKKTILISGGTGTGKTTLLNALIKFIAPHERIITIENVSEIEIDHKIHTNHDAFTYLKDDSKEVAKILDSVLRMRPDRIILGELRNENSHVFLRACNTGHEGTLSTIHANSPKGAVSALLHNIRANSNNNFDENLLKQEIIRNIHAIVQLKREYVNNQMVVKCYLREVKRK